MKKWVFAAFATFISILSLFLAYPKFSNFENVNAQFPPCSYTFPRGATIGSNVPVTVQGTNGAFYNVIIRDSQGNNLSSTTGQIAANGTVTINAPTPSTPGNYTVVTVQLLGLGIQPGFCALGSTQQGNSATLTVTEDSPDGRAHLTATADGNNVTFTWDNIPGWIDGGSYALSVRDVVNNSSCQDSASASSFPGPQIFTSAFGGTFTWNDVPDGAYWAYLTNASATTGTFGDLLLSNCELFTVGLGEVAIGINPCDPDGDGPASPGLCHTALGDIPINPTDFAGKVLEIGTGLAGGLALILMVIGAIRVLTSQGDQQRLAGGREMIIAAIAGLLFVILAISILRLLGFQIFGFTFLRLG